VESKFAPSEPRNNVGVPVTTIGVVVSVVMSVTLLSQLSVLQYFPYASPGCHIDDPFWQDPSDPESRMPIYKEDIYILVVSDKEPFPRMYGPFEIDHKRSRDIG